MLNIVYFSNVSNNTHRFVNSLEWTGHVYRIPIKGIFDYTLLNSYVLICPSYGDANHGHIPPQVKKFLNEEANRKHCVGVIGAGNITFGEDFAKAANILSTKLHVPLLYKFELAGTENDREKVKQGLKEFGCAGYHTPNSYSSKNLVKC